MLFQLRREAAQPYYDQSGSMIKRGKNPISYNKAKITESSNRKYILNIIETAFYIHNK